MARCKACGSEIEWVTTTKGNSMPLDIGEVAGGNVMILLNGKACIVKPDPDVIRSVSHFSTCPEAETFRKRRREQ